MRLNLVRFAYYSVTSEPFLLRPRVTTAPQHDVLVHQQRSHGHGGGCLIPRGRRSLVLPPLLDDGEEGERGDGERGEHGGGDAEGRVDARDARDAEVVGGRGLAVAHGRPGRVQGVGAHVVGRGGDVAGHPVPERRARARARAGGGGVRVRLRLGDLELARLVLAQVVVGLAPPAVLLARRRVAEGHLHRLVPGVRAGRRRRVQTPCHGDRVLAGVQDCEFLTGMTQRDMFEFVHHIKSAEP